MRKNRFNTLYKKLWNFIQELKHLNREKIFSLCFIIAGILLLILPFILIPRLNTELIWKSRACVVEPWFCLDSFTLPQNNLIMNKYDVKAFHYFIPTNGSGSVSFRHIATDTVYTFEVNLNAEEYSISTFFIMVPGEYQVSYGYGLFYDYELWEHGILPQRLDLYVYMGFIVIALTLLLVAYKYFQISKSLTPKNKFT
ncbi:MAG: hypothetical protein ACFFBI_05790 [Promethearchaeota archaeon]